LGAFFGPHAAGDFLFDFHHPYLLFGRVVRRFDAPRDPIGGREIEIVADAGFQPSCQGGVFFGLFRSGVRLRVALPGTNMTQQTAADTLGLSQPTVSLVKSQIERRFRRPRARGLEAIRSCPETLHL
jgi:hypothetical protein